MTTELTSAQRSRMAIDLVEYNGYFKKIADDFKLIEGFYELDMSEWEAFEDDLRGNKVPSPCLVLEDFELVPGNGGSGSFLNTVEGALSVLGQYDPREVAFPSSVFMNYMLYLITQVRSYMVVAKSANCNLMKRLDIKALRVSPIEKVEQYMGFRMPVRLTIEDKVVMDRAEWAFLPFESV